MQKGFWFISQAFDHEKQIAEEILWGNFTTFYCWQEFLKMPRPKDGWKGLCLSHCLKENKNVMILRSVLVCTNANRNFT